ncbi:MAG: autotransporter-associated beta strand repeat-containing protein, partial [Nitratireductor sp.]
TVDLGSAELETDQDSDSAFAGLIAGTGSLVKLGSGILSLTGANTFSGGTTLGEGTLRLEDDDAIGTGALTATGGTLDYDDGIDLSNDIDLRANTNLNVTIGAATQSGNIGETGGSFGIVKTGIGSLELTGTSSFTGGITVNGGDLIGNTANLVGDIGITGGTVEFDQASAGAFTGEITGTGRLVKSGEGEIVFSGSGIEADYFYVRGMGTVLDGVAVDIANRLDISNQLESGGTTDAGLTIRGGANVTSGEGRIGDIDGFEAAVTVSGAGSTWTIGEVADPTSFRVAGEGAASLLVEEGAKVEVIGSASVHSLNGGAASSVAITGENSLFDVSGLLDIGGA